MIPNYNDRRHGITYNGNNVDFQYTQNFSQGFAHGIVNPFNKMFNKVFDFINEPVDMKTGAYRIVLIYLNSIKYYKGHIDWKPAPKNFNFRSNYLNQVYFDMIFNFVKTGDITTIYNQLLVPNNNVNKEVEYSNMLDKYPVNAVANMNNNLPPTVTSEDNFMTIHAVFVNYIVTENEDEENSYYYRSGASNLSVCFYMVGNTDRILNLRKLCGTYVKFPSMGKLEDSAEYVISEGKFFNRIPN